MLRKTKQMTQHLETTYAKINLSKPSPLDNTPSPLRASGTREHAKEVLCWECDKMIGAGGGIQLPAKNNPGLVVIVHPDCPLHDLQRV